MRFHRLSLKITVFFSGIVAATLILCWILNSLFLGDYYLHMKTDALEDAYRAFDSIASDGTLYSDDYQSTFLQICANDNISVIVMSSDGSVLLTSDYDSGRMVERLFDLFFRYDRENADVIVSESDYVIGQQTDTELGDGYLALWGTLSDGNSILIRTALESIEESASIANRFLLYAGLTSIIIGIIISYLYMRRLTKPIYELTNISKEMQAQNFTVKYQPKAKRDELDELGISMNDMSDSLYQTMCDLKNANRMLEADIETREKNEKLRNDFLSAVSHELKTPIALIMGYAEGIKDMAAVSPEVTDDYISIIIDESKKMDTMVKRLVAINQLEAGDLKVDFSYFDLTECIRGLLESYRPRCMDEGIALEFDEGPTYVWSDQFLTEQVLDNYLSNAMHYLAGEKRIRIYYEYADGCLQVHVYNTGSHIPEDALDQIWEKFYKVDKARSREYGGNGIGLSIVKAIQETLGQTYGVANVADGVDFTFTLDTNRRDTE